MWRGLRAACVHSIALANADTSSFFFRKKAGHFVA
jgi:hypothetical protein